jgi:hypothetical protein
MTTEIDKGFHNEFELQLEKAGYRWFPDNWKGSLRGFQKKFVDEFGIKYFITGYHYNLSKMIPDAPNGERYNFDCQFELPSGATIDLGYSASFIPNKYNHPVHTLAQVEEFYDDFWEANTCEYYEEK